MTLKSWLAYAVALTTALASAVSCSDAFPNAEFEKPERCAEAGEFAEVLPHCGLNGSGGLRVQATDKKHDGLVAERELATAREMLSLVCRESVLGYESSNRYMYVPNDFREKILVCRRILRASPDGL